MALCRYSNHPHGHLPPAKSRRERWLEEVEAVGEILRSMGIRARGVSTNTQGLDPWGYIEIEEGRR